MIRCEHCGSMLPEGAIFCGECGRAVTAGASRRPVAPTPSSRRRHRPCSSPTPTDVAPTLRLTHGCPSPPSTQPPAPG
ncbi:zinc-ribbon domain-containing protein [Sphingomonas sp. LR61]|uniref:zinc-ribbon domain-containing protein n=1 Tax=Sphingomonas sp. LR61 TaxID=3050234 RepID=UPI003FA6C5C5